MIAFCSFCAIWGPFVQATPIVVLRTADGFVVGTNSTRSDGQQHCKIHYVGKKLLLVAGQPVGVGEKQGSAGAVRTVLDLHKDLWMVFRRSLSDEILLQAVRDVAVRDISTAVTKYQAKNALIDLVLVSTDGSEPRLWTEIIEFSAPEMARPRVRLAEQKIPVGTTMVWIDTDEPQFFTGSLDIAGVGLVDHRDIPKILASAADYARRHYTSMHLNDRGYDPPFIVLALDSDGLRYVQGDPSPCTRAHPLPAPHGAPQH
jgi:hypothetical protein